MVASATRRDAIAMAQGTTTDRASDRSAKSSCVSVLTWGCCSTSVERTTVAMARIAVGVPGRRCNLLKSDSLDMFIGHQPKDYAGRLSTEATVIPGPYLGPL